jgi:hypothetical protein
MWLGFGTPEMDGRIFNDERLDRRRDPRRAGDGRRADGPGGIERGGIEEVVGDKGYHCNQSLVDLETVGVCSYISEPDRGRRNWKQNPIARDAVYRNRRRIRGSRGRRLLQLRGERLERPFAHLYETGGMLACISAATPTFESGY